MEAGAAAGQAGAAATADGGEAQQQGQEQQQQEQQPGLDPAVLQQLTALPGQLEELRSWMEDQALQTQQTAAADAGQPQPGEADLGFIDPSNPAYDPQQAAGQLLNLLQDQNNRALQEALGPIQEQVQEVQNAREADALAQEFPELQKQEVADQVFSAAQQWVAAAGLPPEFAGNMQVIRAVYMMGRAAELHNQEQQPAPDAASLEGAGGASPGGTGTGSLTAESIIGSQRRSPLPF